MQTDRRTMGRWMARSPKDSRIVSAYRTGTWVLVPFGREYICLPPNGSVIPYSLFAAMTGEAMTDQAMIVLANVARAWLEAVYGDRLETMLTPFLEDHDFVVQCASIPVRVRTEGKTWIMSFTSGGHAHESVHLDLEALSDEIPKLFGANGGLQHSEARTLAFQDQVDAAVLRAQEALIIGQRVKALSRRNPDRLSDDPEILEAMRRVRAIDIPEIHSHRLALGLDDTPADTFDVSHKSLETLLADIKQRG
jgi:hypothetical protein